MAITTTAALTQELQDMISAELLITTDDVYVFVALGPIQHADGDAQQAGTNVIHFNRPTLPTGTYTEASRRLVDGTAVDLTAQTIAETQVDLTTREYGGPHDGASIKPFGMSELLKNRAKHSVVAIVGEFLRRDRNRFLDQTVLDLLLSATTVVTPDESTEAAITPGQVSSAQHLRLINKALKDNKIPPFGNGRWRYITNTRDEMNLKADPDLKLAFQFVPTENPAFSGQVAKFEGLDVFVSTMFSTKAVGGGLVTGYQGVAFGPYGLGWGVALQPSVRRADDTDFGRQEKVIWKSEEAIGTLYADLLIRSLTT